MEESSFYKSPSMRKNLAINGLRSIKQPSIVSSLYSPILSFDRQPDNIQQLQNQLDYAIVHKMKRERMQKKLQTERIKQNQKFINKMEELQKGFCQIKEIVSSEKQKQNGQNKLEKQLDDIQKSIRQSEKNRKKRRYDDNMRYKGSVPRENVNYYILPPTNQVPISYPPYPQPFPYPMAPQMYPMPACESYSFHCYNCQKDNPRKYQQHRQRIQKQKSEPYIQSFKSLETKKTTKYFDVRKKLRKYFYAVFFISVLKSYTKKFSLFRRQQFQKFRTVQFDKEIQILKEWLLQSHQEVFQIILEKQTLQFEYMKEQRIKIRLEKEKLVMELALLGLKTLLENSTVLKITMFSELLYYFCMRGSFPTNEFWTVFQIEKVCLSEVYGSLRIDESLEHFLIGAFVFMKMLLFNMLLQPYKFDAQSFPKNKEPLTSNIKVIATVYYYIIKEVLVEFQNTKRDTSIFNQGNWLSGKKENIVTCSNPLVYGEGAVEEKQFISGLYGEQWVGGLKKTEGWKRCKQILRQILKRLRKDMVEKGKSLRKKFKYDFDI